MKSILIILMILLITEVRSQIHLGPEKSIREVMNPDGIDGFESEWIGMHPPSIHLNFHEICTCEGLTIFRWIGFDSGQVLVRLEKDSNFNWPSKNFSSFSNKYISDFQLCPYGTFFLIPKSQWDELRLRSESAIILRAAEDSLAILNALEKDRQYKIEKEKMLRMIKNQYRIGH